jgi:hypothetical protein
MTPSFGWRKDKFDSRDKLHAPFLKEIPDAVSLAQFCPPVRDQGQLGSCVGFGVGGNISGVAKQCGVFSEWFSPTWVYNGARLIEGSLSEDAGAEPRDALDFLVKNGCLLEHFRPYSDTLDISDPTGWTVASNAKEWPLLSYVRVTDGVPNICDAIAQGYLVSLGASWYESWGEPGSSGVLPEDYSSVAGGHETFLFGYDATKSVFYGQNSWGSSWGKAGTYVMPFSAIEAFKTDGGYDAHYVKVNWSTTPPPPPPPPTPTPGPCAVKLMYRKLLGQKQLKVEESTNGGKTWRQVGEILNLK